MILNSSSDSRGAFFGDSSGIGILWIEGNLVLFQDE